MRDLTSLFSRRREWDWGLFLTYDLNPVTFFETQILNRLVVRRNLTVAIDATNFRRLVEEDPSRPRFAGVYYNLEGIEIRGGGRFHPKLYLLVAEDEVWLAAGSFNLTDTGFKKNLESLVEIHLERSKIDDDGAGFLTDIADFLQSTFVEDNPLVAWRSECLGLTVRDILAAPMFEAVRGRSSRRSRSCHFLASTQGPLISQVLEKTGCSRFKKIEVLSPFYDADASAIKHMATLATQLAIYVPERNSTLPSSLFTQDAAMKRVPVSTVRLEENGFQRFCHAKLYRFHAGTKAWMLATSANLTRPGLVGDEAPRNMEIGVLFPSEGKAKFPNVPNLETARVTDFAAVSVAPPETPVAATSEKPQDQPRILSAYYDKGIVRFSVSALDHSADNALAFLALDGTLDRAYPFSEVGTHFQFDPDLEIEGSKAIELVIEARNKTWKTKSYPVGRRRHEPNQLPALGATAFQRCVNIGGFPGVAEAFKLAASSGREDWLLYLLSHWDLSRILQGLASLPENDRAESDEPHTPAIRQKHVPDFTVQQLRRNVGTVADSDLLLNHLKAFSQGIIDASGPDLLRRLNDFCFPLCLEITWGFMQVLRREEQKKTEHPYLKYPDYTWGNNFPKYLRFAKVIVNTLSAAASSSAWGLSEQVYARWFFAVQATCWYQALHTDKARKELCAELPTVITEANMFAEEAQALVAGKNVPGDLRQRAYDVINRYHGGQRNASHAPSVFDSYAIVDPHGVSCKGDGLTEVSDTTVLGINNRPR